MKNIKVLTIMALLITAMFSGCKKDDDPGVRPTVLSTDPVSSATNRAVNSKISATFSGAMLPSSINNSTFTLQQGTTSVAGTTGFIGTTATFTPSADLTPNTVYTATVTTGATDLLGKSLAKNYTWNFTSSSKSDVVLPSVTLIDPANAATGVALGKVALITFSEPMDAATITAFTVALRQGTAAVTSSVTYTGSVATLTPTSSLLPNKVYTLIITIGVKDMAGNAMAVERSSSFTTGNGPDITLPLVSSTDPANNAIGIAASKVMSVTFSEAMTVSTINATTFTLLQGASAVTGLIAYSGTVATFTPSVALTNGLVYTATIKTGAKDLAGNALAANKVWNFTVGPPDVLAPVVTATNPMDNATAVANNKVVSITFSETMDPLTINGNTFSLKQGTTVVAGTVAYAGIIATFTPTNILLAGLNYTATLTTGAKDLAGNAIANNKVWSFTTGNSTASLATVNLRAAGNYVILAKTAISNISISAVTGDLGLSPAATSYITGLSLTNATDYATSTQITGKVYAADMADPTPINLTTAVENMITAYNDAAGRPSPDFLELNVGNIGGLTLVPGLYKWTNSVTLPSDVTISGGANDVWIFQIAGDLSLSNGVNITLTGGAQAKNIFWQVAGQATLGTTSHFEGILLSWTGINLQTGASFNGRALAQTAVTLDGNAVTKPN